MTKGTWILISRLIVLIRPWEPMGGFAAQPRLPPRARGFARAACQMSPYLRPWAKVALPTAHCPRPAPSRTSQLLRMTRSPSTRGLDFAHLRTIHDRHVAVMGVWCVCVCVCVCARACVCVCVGGQTRSPSVAPLDGHAARTASRRTLDARCVCGSV
jgi:hypothetical protein